MFKDINEKKDAKRKLYKLRQKRATTNYVAEFQQLLFQTNQNNNTLMSQFYKGLKDIVKDKIVYTN